MFEQGAGKLDLLKTYQTLTTYTPQVQSCGSWQFLNRIKIRVEPDIWSVFWTLNIQNSSLRKIKLVEFFHDFG